VVGMRRGMVAIGGTSKLRFQKEERRGGVGCKRGRGGGMVASRFPCIGGGQRGCGRGGVKLAGGGGCCWLKEEDRGSGFLSSTLSLWRTSTASPLAHGSVGLVGLGWAGEVGKGR
jgi:hypothetical protein